MTDTRQSPTRPSAEEDRQLRRWHFFERFGATLAPELELAKLQIRARDARRTVREPVELEVSRARR